MLANVKLISHLHWDSSCYTLIFAIIFKAKEISMTKTLQSINKKNEAEGRQQVTPS
jgi:hypothetical protein